MPPWTLPETRYARSGDVSIAYQVTGDGPFDLVYVPPFASHVELAWSVPDTAFFNRQLASFSRLIRFDKRGQGMSDPVSGAASLETRMDDVRAVMDAVGSERAALLGFSEGGPMSILFAATYPERVWALIVVGSYARVLWAPDYPFGNREEEYRSYVEQVGREWGTAQYSARVAQHLAPSADDGGRRALATLLRQSSEPGLGRGVCTDEHGDRREARLSAIRVPTLVLNRVGDSPAVVGRLRLPGRAHRGRETRRASGLGSLHHRRRPGAAAAGDQQFLTEVWEERAWDDAEPERVLATVLFTDIVGSTAKAAELGDSRWRELIQAHHGLIRRQLVRYRGAEIDTAGDGFFASFDGPARAIRCACAISEESGSSASRSARACIRASASGSTGRSVGSP